jgi:hypothetical protein
MVISKIHRYVTIAPFAIVYLSGCARDPRLVEVEGTLTLRGRPLHGVMICFVPDADSGTLGPRSTGWTNEVGRYRLTCDRPRKAGAVVGKHRVIVLDPEAFDAAPPMLALPDDPGKVPRAPLNVKRKRMQFAVRYMMPGSTPLLAEVRSSGPQVIDLNVD